MAYHQKFGSSHMLHAEFVRSKSNTTSVHVITQIRRMKSIPRVRPFKVDQGLRNRHGSTGITGSYYRSMATWAIPSTVSKI